MMDAGSDEFMGGFDMTNFVDGGEQQGQTHQAGHAGQHAQGHGAHHAQGQAMQQVQQQHQQQQQRQQQQDIFGDSRGGGNRRGMNEGTQMMNMQTQGGAQAGSTHAQNLDALQSLLSMQGISTPVTPSIASMLANTNTGGGHGQAPHQLGPSAQTLIEQQLRLNQLQQLQQLQNQIFQQQIELISGQTIAPAMGTIPQNDMFRDQNQLHGLPTPANSAELRAVDANFVQPMQNYYTSTPQAIPQFPSPHVQGTNSAPANIAFQQSNALPSPGLDFLEPITSPWLGPHAFGNAGEQAPQTPTSASSPTVPAAPSVRTRASNKRAASASHPDDADPRKRQSPAIRPTPPSASVIAAAGLAKRQAAAQSQSQTLQQHQQQHQQQQLAHARNASLGTTPVMKSRSRKGSTAGDEPGDTPSPVDPSSSMPPPAPPGVITPSPTSSSAAAASSQRHNTSSTMPMSAPVQIQPLQPASISASGPGAGSAPALASPMDIAPVTPASIMNLGRLGLSSGLSPPMNGLKVSAPATSRPTKQVAVKPKLVTTNGTIALPSAAHGTQSSPASAKPTIGGAPKRGSPTVPLISPSLKPLLPGGLPPSSVIHLANSPNYKHHIAGMTDSLNLTPTTPLPQPTLQVRKTSHKAAEQKRRDSLKTSFDDLRLLLPPIPLPSEEGYDGEPLLPGAMPPRGPPRGDNGPNRAVSKLQLLRCGNDYLRQLKARVERRDEYIDQMRREIAALRGMVPSDMDMATSLSSNGVEMVDLEKDIDAVEAGQPKLGGANAGAGDEDDEE